MAGDKKPEIKKPSEPLISVERTAYTLLGFFLVLMIVSRVIDTLSTIRLAEGVSTSGGVVFVGNAFRSFIIPVFKFLSVCVSVLAFFGIYWSAHHAGKIFASYKAQFDSPVSGAGEIVPEQFKNKRWERVLEHMKSPNQSDWKFAIIEADIMLSDLLDKLIYKGETIADKLKKVEPSDFRTIEAAWEAHKIRNMVAHEGTDFVITEREAKRVIGLYQSVFEEFHFI